MGSPSDNIAKLKHAYREWHDSKGGSVKTWLDLVADDVKVYSLAAGAPEVEFTAAVSSKKDFERYFTGLLADWEMIHYTTGTFIAEGKPRGHARLHGLAQPEDRPGAGDAEVRFLDVPRRHDRRVPRAV